MLVVTSNKLNYFAGLIASDLGSSVARGRQFDHADSYDLCSCVRGCEFSCKFSLES
jgi:hypothetical protein